MLWRSTPRGHWRMPRAFSRAGIQTTRSVFVGHSDHEVCVRRAFTRRAFRPRGLFSSGIPTTRSVFIGHSVLEVCFRRDSEPEVCFPWAFCCAPMSCAHGLQGDQALTPSRALPKNGSDVLCSNLLWCISSSRLRPMVRCPHPKAGSVFLGHSDHEVCFQRAI